MANIKKIQIGDVTYDIMVDDKYIFKDMGTFSSIIDGKFLTKCDEMHGDSSKGYEGYYRAFIGKGPIEVYNFPTDYSNDKWIQIIRSPFRWNGTNFNITEELKYRTLYRVHENGEWGGWKDTEEEIINEIKESITDSYVIQIIDKRESSHGTILPKDFKQNDIIEIELIGLNNCTDLRTYTLYYAYLDSKGEHVQMSIGTISANSPKILYKVPINGASKYFWSWSDSVSNHKLSLRISNKTNNNILKYIESNTQQQYKDIALRGTIMPYYFSKIYPQGTSISIEWKNTTDSYDPLVFIRDITGNTNINICTLKHNKPHQFVTLPKPMDRMWVWGNGMNSGTTPTNLRLTFYENDNKKYETYKYIHLGQESTSSQNMTNFTNQLNTLSGLSDVGFYRIVANNQTVAEVHNIQLSSSDKHIMQILKGPFKINSTNGLITIDGKNYRTAFRNCLKGVWNEWTITNTKQELEDGIKEIEQELTARIQGTSANSNPSTDPFRFLIKVGDINEEDGEGNNRVLKALDALHSKSDKDNFAGRWRIIASNNAYDVENVVTHYVTEKWLQIFHGPFTISKTGFSFGSFDYKTSWREYKNGKWSDWQCREDDIVELTKGTSPNSPSTYSTPMFLGGFTNYADFLAKLDDMHYNEKTTFQKDKGNCVGWFRAKAGTDYIDIKCVCRYVFGDSWQQVISGFFKLNSAGALEASTTEYTTLFRNRAGSYNSSTGVAVEGTWSEWKKIN